MVWGKSKKKVFQKRVEGIKVGCWNKGGALQPMKEKLIEIELLIKSNNFGVFEVLEANFFEDADPNEVKIEGFSLVWDKGRKNKRRRNARTALYIREDLSYKVRDN